MLQKLKQHLRQQRIVSLYDLVNMLHCDPEVLRDMLQRWIDKGKVMKCLRTPSCGQACFKCDPLRTEMYQWIMPHANSVEGECTIFFDNSHLQK